MRISDAEANRLLVLKTIRRTEPVARTELAQLTGISHSLIGNIVSDLLQRQLLLEAKSPGTGRGRPRLQIMLNPEAAYVVGAYVSANPPMRRKEGTPGVVLGVEICNMRGDKLFGKQRPLKPCANLGEFADELSSAIESALKDSGYGKSRINRVGVALPATVAAVSGVVHWFTFVCQQPTPFASLVEQRLGLPVTIENSIDVMARSEHWFGQDRHVDDFSLFAVGPMIGFSRYVGGLLCAGDHGVNSELSHVKVGALDGPQCPCGARSCLGVTATIYGAVLRICEARDLPRPEVDEVLALFATFAREAQAGDATAVEAFNHCGRILGVAVANHVNMMDPARVLVLVTDPVFADLIVASFYASLKENTFTPLRGMSAVQFKVADEIRWSHGAAALVLEQLYRAPSLARAAAEALSA
jgi:predicted NBD/HSP70 family sugar kinase